MQALILLSNASRKGIDAEAPVNFVVTVLSSCSSDCYIALLSCLPSADF